MSLLDDALTHHRCGNLVEAERLYRAALAAALAASPPPPETADIHSLLGTVLEATGRLDDALDQIGKAIALDPDCGLFYLHQGNALQAAGRYPEAITSFRAAADRVPTIACPTQACIAYNLGNCFRLSGQMADAIAAFRTALQWAPDHAEAHNNLALLLDESGNLTEALAHLETAVRLAPGYGEAWVNLCKIADALKNYPLAQMAGEQAIRLAPENPRSWFGLALTYNRLGRDEEALTFYRKSLDLDATAIESWDNLGQTYQLLGQIQDAEAAYSQTIQRQPDYAAGHWNKTLTRLLQGDLADGFKGYEWRWSAVSELKRLDYPEPIWRGEPLQGRTLLVADEQGFGDTLQFSRYLPLIAEKFGGKVLFLCPTRLFRLFQNRWPQVEVHARGGPMVPFDCHASLLDLPHIFGTTLETIPADIPYLSARSALEDNPAAGRQKRVGLVWAGHANHRHDHYRSIKTATFRPLLETPGIDFVSLQKPVSAEDAATLAQLGIPDLGTSFTDFQDSADAIAGLDLIITVDTAVAHLAGAMGKQVWILLPFAPDWRWMLDRPTSPWYPTARLFRQQSVQERDWKAVIARVQVALRQMTSQ
jgi:tetratricopeptide (TPR) repeat protein